MQHQHITLDCLRRYLTRQKLNLSFYEVASNIASPITYATVQSGNLDRPLDSYPTLQDYIDIFSICGVPSGENFLTSAALLS